MGPLPPCPAEETPKQKKKIKQAAAAAVGAVVDSEGNAAVSTEKKKVSHKLSNPCAFPVCVPVVRRMERNAACHAECCVTQE